MGSVLDLFQSAALGASWSPSLMEEQWNCNKVGGLPSNYAQGVAIAGVTWLSRWHQVLNLLARITASIPKVARAKSYMGQMHAWSVVCLHGHAYNKALYNWRERALLHLSICLMMRRWSLGQNSMVLKVFGTTPVEAVISIEVGLILQESPMPTRETLNPELSVSFMRVQAKVECPAVLKLYRAVGAPNASKGVRTIADGIAKAKGTVGSHTFFADSFCSYVMRYPYPRQRRWQEISPLSALIEQRVPHRRSKCAGCFSRAGCRHAFMPVPIKAKRIRLTEISIWSSFPVIYRVW